MCDLHSIFGYLPNFVPLIQLLAGSVFLAAVFFRKTGSEIEESFKPPYDNNNVIVGDNPTIHKYKLHEVFLEDFRFLQTRTMLLLAVYSCLVLFFCSTFRCCHIPSYLGLSILSGLLSTFQIYALFCFGRWRPFKKLVQFLLIAFIIIGGGMVFFPNLDYFSDNCTTFVNVLVIINMLFWISLYIRREILIKKCLYLINKLYNLRNSLLENEKCQTEIQIVNNNKGIEDILEKIIDGLAKNEKKHNMYYEIARELLSYDDLFFRITDIDLKSKHSYSDCPEILTNLNNIIDQSSFKDNEKKNLKEIIKRDIKPTVSLSLFQVIKRVKDKIFDNYLKDYKSTEEKINKRCELKVLKEENIQ